MGAALDAGEVATAEGTNVNPLRFELDARLSAGPVPAAEVMALALYHPQHGYYRRAVGPWGFEGKDYYTALDLGPLLGETLALRLEQAWERLERPTEFTVLEVGAGRGWLGRDILNATSEPFAAALRYIHRDDNPAARKAAQEALAPFLATGRARFINESDPIEPLIGAVLSNELFDALPAQPWRWDCTRWVREVLTQTGPEWHAHNEPTSSTWFESQGDGIESGDGSVWCEALPLVASTLAKALQAGLFITLDYGDHASRLLAKGADLRRFKEHTVDGKWWEELGESDLTADVDFTRLSTILEGIGLKEVTHESLSRWIRAYAPLAQWEAQWQTLEPRQRIQRMENLLQLTMPSMMGERFRVLEGWKR
jgi:SAM-dependent MidA family methyltransferase